jgi:hypothetical protein
MKFRVPHHLKAFQGISETFNILQVMSDKGYWLLSSQKSAKGLSHLMTPTLNFGTENRNACARVKVQMRHRSTELVTEGAEALLIEPKLQASTKSQ